METPDPGCDFLSSVGVDLSRPFPDPVKAIDDTEVFSEHNERWKPTAGIASASVLSHVVHSISGMGAALAFKNAYVLADELETGLSVEGVFKRVKR